MTFNLKPSIIGTTLDPEWAQNHEDNWDVLNTHNHAGDEDPKIPTAGLDIDNDLNLNGFNLTDFRSAIFNNLTTDPSNPTDICSVYWKNGNLYANNSAGAHVQITSGTGLNISVGAANAYEIKLINANYPIIPADTFTYGQVDSTSTAITIFLAAANTIAAGRFYIFFDASGNSETNNITFNASGSDTMNGTTDNYLAKKNYGGWLFVTDGSSQWFVAPFANTDMINGTFIGNGSDMVINAVNNTLTVQNSKAGTQYDGATGNITTIADGNINESATGSITIAATSGLILEGSTGFISTTGTTLIDAPLTQVNNTLQANIINFVNQGSTLDNTHQRDLYASGNALYWNDASGNVRQIVNTDGYTAVNFVTKSVNIGTVLSAADTFNYLKMDTSGGAHGVTLPAANAVANGRVYFIKDSTGNSETNNITVTRAGSDTIDGQTTAVLKKAFGSWMFVSDGISTWSASYFINKDMQNGTFSGNGTDMTISNDSSHDITIAARNVTIAASNNNTFAASTLNQFTGVTQFNNLAICSAGASVSGIGLTVNNGATINSGGLAVVTGGLTVQAGTTTIQGAALFTNTATLQNTTTISSGGTFVISAGATTTVNDVVTLGAGTNGRIPKKTLVTTDPAGLTLSVDARIYNAVVFSTWGVGGGGARVVKLLETGLVVGDMVTISLAQYENTAALAGFALAVTNAATVNIINFGVLATYTTPSRASYVPTWADFIWTGSKWMVFRSGFGEGAAPP